MNKKLFWACIAVLVICGALLFVFRMGDEKKEIALSPTDDSSQFVTLTDAVPDVILEIRTSWEHVSMVTSNLQP